MKCPECKSDDNYVYDSRRVCEKKINSVKRRRECKDCFHRWNTYEMSEEEMNRVRRFLEVKEEFAMGILSL